MNGVQKQRSNNHENVIKTDLLLGLGHSLLASGNAFLSSLLSLLFPFALGRTILEGLKETNKVKLLNWWR